MADRDHVAAIRGGKNGLAEFISVYGPTSLDLTDAVIRDVDLSGCNLNSGLWSGAQIEDVDLRRAEMDRIDLMGSHLSRVDLTDAVLFDGRLVQSRFEECLFTGTKLVGVDCSFAEFRSCSFVRADLTTATLFAVSFDNVDMGKALSGLTRYLACDLNEIRGLDKIEHVLDSSVDIDTLVRTLQSSSGTFTDEQRTFLLSAAVPEIILDELPRLLRTKPLEFFSCFISFGFEDKEFVDLLARDLKSAGVDCWKYDEDAIEGRGVWSNIDRAITLHQKAILVCSSSSLRREGVLREIERALQREDDLRNRSGARGVDDPDVLVPIRLDDFVFDGWVHPRRSDVIAKHVGDFRGWEDEVLYRESFGRLLHALDPTAKLGLAKEVRADEG